MLKIILRSALVSLKKKEKKKALKFVESPWQNVQCFEQSVYTAGTTPYLNLSDNMISCVASRNYTTKHAGTQIRTWLLSRFLLMKMCLLFVQMVFLFLFLSLFKVQ